MNATLKLTLALVVLLLVGALSVHGLIPNDPDGDGVPDPDDVCPSEDASGFDRNGDGCIDDGSGARHIEYWGWVDSVVVYVINELGAPGVAGDSDLDAVQSAFDAWTSIPGTELEANFGGTVPQAVANGLDKVNLVTFTDGTYPFGFTTLAVGLSTSFVADTLIDGRVYRPGEIFDTDMIFNPLYPFGTSGAPTLRDIQSVATHEAGHMLGLSHAAIGTSTMYFVLPSGINARSLEDDDVAVYLKAYGNEDVMTGSSRLEGVVTNGQTSDPVPGAVVFAINETTGDSSACDFTLPDGSFTFVGLADGDYFVAIHPLDGTEPIGHMTARNVNVLLDAIAETDFMAEAYDAAESNTDDPTARTAVAVSDGNITTIEIVTNIDAEPPTVLSANPPDGTTNAAIDGAYVIEFSERIDTDTIDDAFSFRDALANAIPGNLAIIRDDSVVVYTPTSPLDYAASYTLRIDTDLQDRAGNALESDFVVDIVTEPEPALAITSLAPNKGVVGNTVVINGHGFDNAPSVTFDGVSATISSHGPNSIVAVVPVGAETGDVVVTNSDLETSAPVVFTVLSASEIARGYESGTVSLFSAPNAIALGPNGEYAYVAVTGGIEAVVVNPASLYLSHALIDEPGTFRDVAATPDGKRVYALNETAGTIVEVFAETGPLFHTIIASRPLGATPRSIVVDPFGYRAYVSTDEAEIQAWDIRLGSPTYQQQVSVLHTPDGIPLAGEMAITPAGNRLLALGGSGEVFFYDLGPNTLAHRIPVNVDPRHIVIDPQGQRAYVADGNGDLSVLSIDGAPFFVQDIATGGSLRGLDTTPAGLYLYASDRELDNLKIVDLDETSSTFRSVIEDTPQIANPVDVALSSDGVYAFSVLQGDVAAPPRMSVTTIGIGPTMLSMVPTAGQPGTQVVFNMSGLSEDVETLAIDFNGAIAPALFFDESIVLTTVPDGVTTGPVTAVATFYSIPGSQSSNPMQFTALAPSSPHNIRSAGTVPIDYTMVSCDYITPAVALSPNGNFLYTGCGGTNEVNVFDLRPGSPTFHKMLGAFGSPTGGGGGSDVVRDISITADGKVAFVCGGQADELNPRRVQTFYADPNDPRFLTRGPSVIGPDVSTPLVTTSPNNRTVVEYVAGLPPGGPTLMILDATNVSNGTTPTMADSTGTGAVVNDIVHHPSSRAAYVGLETGLIRVFDTNPSSGTFGLAVGTFASGLEQLWSLAASPDGSALYAYGTFFTDLYSYRIVTFDASNPTFLASPTTCEVNLESLPPLSAGIFRLAPQGDFGIRTLPDVGFFRHEVACGPPVVAAPLLVNTLMDFAFTPDGSHVYAANQQVGEIQVYDFLLPNTLVIAAGNGQEGVVNEVLPVTIRAQVTTDISDTDLSGVPLTFTVASGGGSIVTSGGPATQAVVATDEGGFAEVTWMLGPVLGAQTVSVTGEGLAGSPLTFTANANADPSTLPLSLAQIIPLDGSTNISPTTALLATFSRAIDPTTITSSSFYLREGPTGPALPATFGFTDSDRKVSVTPSAALDVATAYEIVVTGAITASGGPALSNPGVSHFTTLAAQPLHLASVWPPSSLRGIAVTLSGTGFDPDFADNVVMFNGVAATPFEGTSDVLRVVVPLTAVTGTIQVVSGLQTSNTVPFVVLYPSTTTIDDVIANIGTSSGAKSIAISADGTLCYSVGTDGDVVIPVDIETATTYASIPVGDQPVAIVMHPAGTFAYVANFNSGTVSVIDVDPLSTAFNTVVESITVGTNPIDLAITADGDRLAVANAGSSNVSIVDTDESSVAYNEVLGTVPTESGAKSVAYSGDGTLYVGTATAILVMQASTGASYEVLGTVPTESGTKSMAISGDGTLLFALTDDGDLLVIDIQDGSATENQVLGTVPTESGAKSVAISGDGTLLYLVMEDTDEVLVFALSVLPGVGVIDPGAAPTFRVSFTFITTFETGSDPADVAVDPSGSGRVIVANPGDKTLRVYGPGFDAVQATVVVTPHTLNLKSNGKYVTARIEVPPPYLAQEIVVSTVRLQGTIPVVPGLEFIADTDNDGIDELVVSFDRTQFQAVLPQGEFVEVTVEGQVRDRMFIAEDVIRTLRPTVTHPHNVHLMPGSQTTITWTTPAGYTAPLADVHFSSDNGDHWTDVALQIPNTGSLAWTVPPLSYAPQCFVMVTLWNNGEIFGHGMSQEPFMIGSTVTVRLKSFDVAMEDGTAVLRWETSLELGMEGYQIVRSDQETGRYDTITEDLIRPSGEATGGSYEYRDEGVTANRTYWYKLREVANDGLGAEYGPYSVTYRLSNRLDQNVPNPFNPTTTIKYAIASDENVNLTVYDVAGRQIRTLVNERQRADVHRVVWDGVNDAGERVASGVYFYRLAAGKFTQTKKMLLLK
jgi:YVTN family beta-propeller protein